MSKKKNLNFMNSVRVPIAKSSVFDLTHDVKLSCNMGYLVPVMVTDLVPGDKINIAQESLIRFAPLVSPMFQRCQATFHTWAIPYRILWPNWEKYITEKKTGGFLPAFPTMLVDADGSDYTPLLDYLGVPPPSLVDVSVVADETISAMRVAAYNCVYQNFYRDENLCPDIEFLLHDGDNTATLDRSLQKRAWGHDYFTSNLPFAQKGDAVDIPIGGFNDVPVNINDDTATPWQSDGKWSNGADDVNPNALGRFSPDFNPQQMYIEGDDFNQSSTTVNDFRLAMTLQRYLERAARAGTRLVEWIKGMFGETLPDYTAQIPQYVGGSVVPIQVSEVLNTTGTTELPQGNMAGRAIGVNNQDSNFYHAREHCVLITIMNITPLSCYQQGMDRNFLKINHPTDFMNPMFAHLGEQPTFYSELLAFVGRTYQTFGYLPRYAEYRTIPSRVAGDFRDTLNHWTMARIFETTAPDQPELNEEFIKQDPTHRVFADTDEADEKMYVHVLNKIRCVRQLPTYGTPI